MPCTRANGLSAVEDTSTKRLDSSKPGSPSGNVMIPSILSRTSLVQVIEQRLALGCADGAERRFVRVLGRGHSRDRFRQIRVLEMRPAAIGRNAENRQVLRCVVDRSLVGTEPSQRAIRSAERAVERIDA